MEEQQLVKARVAIPVRVGEWRGAALTVVAVGVGGLVGANLRWWLGEWSAEQWSTPFPWGTLLINLSGSLVLGLYLAFVSTRQFGAPRSRLFVATGAVGAYTTFSTFAYETVRLLQHGHAVTALAYVGASLVGGLVACAVGITIGRRA